MQTWKNEIYHQTRICPEGRGNEMHIVGIILVSIDKRYIRISARKLREKCLTSDFFL